MNDFLTYSQLYHYGVKGMHWGVRKTPIKKNGNKKKSVIKKANEKIEDILSNDNKHLDKLTKTSGGLRKSYHQQSKAKTEKQKQEAMNRASKFADLYFKKYGNKPLTYEQYKNAKKGAIAGTVVGIAIPVIIPLWASIPVGYYVGSKIKTKKDNK